MQNNIALPENVLQTSTVSSHHGVLKRCIKGRPSHSSEGNVAERLYHTRVSRRQQSSPGQRGSFTTTAGACTCLTQQPSYNNMRIHETSSHERALLSWGEPPFSGLLRSAGTALTRAHMFRRFCDEQEKEPRVT
jgi:hypothetical protein